MIKNLKVTKKTAVLVSGFLLSQTMIYTGFVAGTGLKPFAKNEYEVHRFDIEEYGKDGIVVSELYQDSLNLQTSFLVRTPYSKNQKGELERKVYRIPTEFYSDDEVEYTLIHIKDQKLLLEQNYVQEMIEDTKNQSNDFALLQKEIIEELPQNNDYEISYALFSEDKDDVQIMNSFLSDAIVTGTYLAFAGGAAIIELEGYGAYQKRKKKD